MIVAASVRTSLTALFNAFEVICEDALLIKSADMELLMLELNYLLNKGHVAPDDALVVPDVELCCVQFYYQKSQQSRKINFTW